jgi:6-phosphofructokinase 1
MIQKIGILTSGGDSPGMNATIVGAVRTGINLGKEMYVVYDGYRGLVSENFIKVGKDFALDKLNQGGTCIKTARLPEFKELPVREKAVAILKKEGIEGLIVIGGDGSYMGAKKLTDMGINCVGLPGTIDNDIASTDYTIGFDTALNTVVEEVDKVVDTSSSHRRCALVEIMGNNCPDLTIFAAIATNADYVLTKDYLMPTDKLIEGLKEKKKNNADHVLILVAEKLLDTEVLAKKIQEETGWDTRATILGHTQRGGRPSAMERVNAIKMGAYAVELLDKGIGGVCVGIVDNKPKYYPIDEALKLPCTNRNDLYKLHELLR